MPVRNYANFSDCQRYRYELGRCWSMEPKQRVCMWVMLNPSTADASINDRTIARCIEFSKAWGFDALVVGNLYAWRATKPADMWNEWDRGIDIVGRDNLTHLRFLAGHAERIVCAWGSEADDNHAEAVLMELSSVNRAALCYLHMNADGQPKHPLYVKGDTEPEFYSQMEVPL